MFPGIVVAHPEIYLDERPPLWTFGFADEVEAGFLRGAVGFFGITLDAGANDIFPGGRAAAIARDHVVKIQVAPIEHLAAILAGVVVAFEDIVAREFHFLLRHPVEEAEQDDARHADPERNGMDAFRVRLLIRKIVPLRKVVGLEGPIGVVEDHLRVPFEEEREGAPGGADVDRLPKPVQHQNLLVQKTHNNRLGLIAAESTIRVSGVSTGVSVNAGQSGGEKGLNSTHLGVIAPIRQLLRPSHAANVDQ